MIKEIIFDCFGVLTQDGWTAFLKKYETPETIDELRATNVLSDKGLITFPEFVRRAAELTGTDETTVYQVMTNSLHPNDEVFELARALSTQYQLGIISNVGSPLDTYFPEHDLDIFTVQTLSFQVGVIKPSAEIFELHVGRSGIEPQNAVFIDDRESNCEGARAVGMQAIYFQNLDQLKAELADLGVKIP